MEGYDHRGHGGRATWTATGKDGSVSRGLVEWSKSAQRPATPSLAGLAAVDFVQGDYAANLVTVDEATRAFGRPFSPPVANGGRLQMRIGLDASNGRADSVDGELYAQWTVYRTVDAPAGKAYFDLDAPISYPQTLTASRERALGPHAHDDPLPRHLHGDIRKLIYNDRLKMPPGEAVA